MKVKKLVSLAREICASHVVVASYWDAETSSWREAKHYALGWQDALNWARCYDDADVVEIYEAFIGIAAKLPIAMRGIYRHDGALKEE